MRRSHLACFVVGFGATFALTCPCLAEDIEFAPGAHRPAEPEAAPASEWSERWESAQADGSTASRFAAAWWALENGLIPECASALRVIHQGDPSHQPTARMVQVLDGLDHPCPDPGLSSVAPLLQGLPGVDHSPHIVLAHDLGPDEVAARLDLLEDVLVGFYLSMTAYGTDLDFPKRKAIVLWMPDRDSYRQALRKAGAGDFASTRGYFHPTLQIMLTYDGRGTPEHRRGQAVVDRQRRQQDRLLSIARGREPGSVVRLGLPGEPADGWERDEAIQALESASRDLDQRQTLLDLERIDIEFAAAAHELVHLLVRASGLAPTHDAFPVWLHEGLAMQFEVVRDGRWAGVGRVNPHRLAFRPGADRPLRLDRVTRDQGLGANATPEAYAEAWALVYYLRKQHPDAFQSLLDHLRQPGRPAGGTPVDRGAEAIRAIFGAEAKDLEARWQDFLQPLASNPANTVSRK